MQAMLSFAAWVESTRVALLVGSSIWIVAALSAIHLLGFTLAMGSALVLNARLARGMVSQVPVGELAGPASSGITAGVVLSILSGVLLASWKLTTVLPSGVFQIKMSLLVLAALMHFAWQRPRLKAEPEGPALKASAIPALILWLGLAAAGCAFILFE